MRSWVFRNRSRLQEVYGAPGRPRPLTERGEGGARRLIVYRLIPLGRLGGGLARGPTADPADARENRAA